MKLSETTVKKSNNLQLMRFIAAVMVIFAHSYAISGSVKGTDFIDRHTGGIISIGGISVTLFFLCSGYLISKSIMRTKGFLPYKSKTYQAFAAALVGGYCVGNLGCGNNNTFAKGICNKLWHL